MNNEKYLRRLKVRQKFLSSPFHVHVCVTRKSKRSFAFPISMNGGWINFNRHVSLSSGFTFKTCIQTLFENFHKALPPCFCNSFRDCVSFYLSKPFSQRRHKLYLKLSKTRFSAQVFSDSPQQTLRLRAFRTRFVPSVVQHERKFKHKNFRNCALCLCFLKKQTKKQQQQRLVAGETNCIMSHSIMAIWKPLAFVLLFL